MILYLGGVFLKNEQKISVKIDLARKANNIHNSKVIMKQLVIVVSFIILYFERCLVTYYKTGIHIYIK